MTEQPDCSRYSLRFVSVVPLDRGRAELDEAAFDRFDIELLTHDDEGEQVVVATAVAFRLKFDSGEDFILAADAEPDSRLLEQVCLRALAVGGGLRDTLDAAVVDPVSEVMVLDRIRFQEHSGDEALLRGMLARGVLDHLAPPFTALFLPPEHADLWDQSVGAVEVAGFVIACSVFQLPEFPFAGISVD
ncbi:MAG: hypothetical protein ABMB14_06790 [Myxococcota bacterium]